MEREYRMSYVKQSGTNLLKAMAAVIVSFAAAAASITHAEFTALKMEATAGKYVSVLVGLDTGIPLTQRREQAAKIASLESALLKNLGPGVLTSGVWSNGIGQMGLMVTQEGLAQLVEHRGVNRVIPNPGHSIIHDPYGQLRKIQEMIDKTGVATVLIIQQLDNLEWGLSALGEAEFKHSTALENEFRTKAPEFVATLPAQAILNLPEAKSRAAAGLIRRSPTLASPELLLVINQEGFLHLQARRDIRSMRMPELEGVIPVELDSRVLEAASKDGYASVIIALKMPAGYSAAQGYMSKRSWDAQAVSLRSAMNDIIGSLFSQNVPPIQHYDGLAGASVVLPIDVLRSLYNKPDPRIGSIRLNDPIEPALSISTGNGTGGVNVQQLWKIGRASCRERVYLAV